MNQLDRQKHTDAIAIAFAVALAIPIDFFGSLALGVAIGGAEYVDVAFVALFLLSPLWFWLALRLRRFIGWPRDAFARADFVTKDPGSD